MIYVRAEIKDPLFIFPIFEKEKLEISQRDPWMMMMMIIKRRNIRFRREINCHKIASHARVHGDGAFTPSR